MGVTIAVLLQRDSLKIKCNNSDKTLNAVCGTGPVFNNSQYVLLTHIIIILNKSFIKIWGNTGRERNWICFVDIKESEM